MSIQEITVPDIGHFSGVEVIEVAVSNGDTVHAEDTLITLETEKASMDVPSPVTGKIHELKVKLGDKLSQGDLIALIEVTQEASPPSQDIIQEKPQQEPAQASSKSVTVTVPDTGGAKQVEVIEVSVKPGDEIALEDTLITLESEKASMDIPSPYAGKVDSVLVKIGDKVTMGSPIVTMQAKTTAEQPQKEASEVASQIVPTRPPAAAKQPSLESREESDIHAGPATRQLARLLGVDLRHVTGTGLKNRIVTSDVQAYVKSVMQGRSSQGSGLAIEQAPEIDFSQFGEIEVKPLSRIKKWTAKNLHRNWVSIPHVTQFDEADISELEVFRQENKQAADDNGIKLTPLAFIIKAVVSAMKTYPQFNASLAANGTDVVYKKYFHIGVAVDTPNGLVVPVLKDADTKGLFDIARELGELSALAREGKLKSDQMQGNCFSITSLGGVGGTAFTPIINAPDVAILGVSKAQMKPIYIDEQFVARRMLPLSLSYDHRVIDGVEAAKFITYISEQLQDIRKLLL